MNLIKSLNYFQWAPSARLRRKKLVRSSGFRLPMERRTKTKQEGKTPRKKRATDGAQQIRGGMRSFKTVKLLTSRARGTTWLGGFLSLGRIFHKKWSNFKKISRGYQCNPAWIIEASARGACVWVCNRETLTKSKKREERVKREFNTQNLKIIVFAARRLLSA